MKAMIFAAGLGSRLKPLTDSIPKALVTVGDQPMLGRLIHRLAKQGVSSFIVNVHHFSAQVIEYLNTAEFKDLKISISDESGKLLDTGGGLFKAAGFFSDCAPFLVYNVDVLSDIHVNEILEHHRTETKPFPILELYLSLAENYRIGVYIHEPYNWADMGSPEGLKKAELLLPVIDPATSL